MYIPTTHNSNNCLFDIHINQACFGTKLYILMYFLNKIIKSKGSFLTSISNIFHTEFIQQYNLFSEKPNDTLFKDRTIIIQTVLTSKDTAYYQSRRLMYAIIGLSVAAVLITITYSYTCQLEKSNIFTGTVWYLDVLLFIFLRWFYIVNDAQMLTTFIYQYFSIYLYSSLS